jgi:DNA replication protein DnaC
MEMEKDQNTRQEMPTKGMAPDGITSQPSSGLDAEKLIQAELFAMNIGTRFLTSAFKNYTDQQAAMIARSAIEKSPISDIYMHGPTGCGKTHLAVAMVRHIIESGRIVRDDGKRRVIIFKNMADLIFEIKQTFGRQKDDGEKEFIDKYSAANLLILDDIGAENVGDWSTQVLYLIIEHRYRNMLPTVATSNLQPSELEKTHGSRVVSRLCSGTLIKIEMPDFRKRRQA